jgi:NADH:ubiquinone oxidoreductase subunit 3 (subunit A)
MNWLFSPPIAFVIFLGLAALLSWFGRVLAAPAEAPSVAKSTLYASGEAADPISAAPGYRQFFVIALFFAMLHLGVLILGSGGLTWITTAYLSGLMIALLALILG